MSSSIKTLSISLPESLIGYVKTRAKKQGNVSDYIRSLIREEQKREQEIRLQKLLLEGIRSGSSVLTPEKWERLKIEILGKVKE